MVPGNGTSFIIIDSFWTSWTKCFQSVVSLSGVSVRGGEREWELGAVWRPSLALSSAAVTRRRQGRFITLSPSVRSHTFDIWQLPGRPWRLEGKLKATLKLQERVLRVTVTVWMNRARHTAQWVGLGLYSRDPLWPIILFASLNDFIP